MTSLERVVHAALPGGGQIVRYDRAGKWFIEWPGKDRKRVPVTVQQAAGVALSVEGARTPLNRYGGLRFDHAYRQLQKGLSHAADADDIHAEFRKLVTEP